MKMDVGGIRGTRAIFVRNELARRGHVPRFRRHAVHFVLTRTCLLGRDMHRRRHGDELARRKRLLPRHDVRFAVDTLNACRLAMESERTESVSGRTSARNRLVKIASHCPLLIPFCARGSSLLLPFYTSGFATSHDRPRRRAGERKPNGAGYRVCSMTARLT